MRILQIHKFFYRRGGAETVFLDTVAGLKNRGHEVAEFSTRHKNNFSSQYASYFVAELPELGAGRFGPLDAWKIFRRLFHSTEVNRQLRALVLATEPQVAHLHNVYHHLSADIFKTLKKLKLPIVLTVHDVFPMCPNHRMLRNTDVLCEQCYRHRFFQCAIHRCVNDKFFPSLAASLEAYYYWLARIWKLVDVFICPSQFFLDKMIKWGFDKNKLRLMRNPFVLPPEAPALGNKILYLGRLHPEKGIRVFLNSLSQLRAYPVVIAGLGPDEERVQKTIRHGNFTNVEQVGWVGGEKWQELMRDARVVVVPSLFYENCSLAVLEAMAHGRVVVAADRGGNVELIQDSVSGFLARPDDPDSLAEAVKKAMTLSASEAEKIGEEARAQVRENHDPDKYFAELEKIYGEVVK